VTSGSEVRRDRPIGGEELLGVSWRFEALHPSLPLVGGLVGVLGAVVQVAMLPMFHIGEYLPLRGPIAFQLIGHEDSRDVPTPFEQLPKAFLGGCFVTAALHEDVEDTAILIHRPPQVVPLTTNREKDLIQMPIITLLRAPASQLIGI
jgi:hypothetical protein